MVSLRVAPEIDHPFHRQCRRRGCNTSPRRGHSPCTYELLVSELRNGLLDGRRVTFTHLLALTRGLFCQPGGGPSRRSW